jgi:hypothetical protein
MQAAAACVDWLVDCMFAVKRLCVARANAYRSERQRAWDICLCNTL